LRAHRRQFSTAKEFAGGYQRRSGPRLYPDIPALSFRKTQISGVGLVSRVTPVHTAVRNFTRDEGGPFEVGNQVLISNHRKLLWAKVPLVGVAEKSEHDFDGYD
jgi:hypothetical protein